MLCMDGMLKVVVPTLNAAKDWGSFAPALLSCVRPQQVLVLDSESVDGTVELARSAGCAVHSLFRSEFNHGGTRQLAAEMLNDTEYLVYLTQDAVLAGADALSNLIAAFDDPLVGAAYGRQLPRPEAGLIETHARQFNYPEESNVRSLASRKHLGIKAAFLSNSFAAYRRSALMAIGGFPTGVIFGEDMVTAARLLFAGYKVAYVASSRAHHSHPYTPVQEFKRYFDIGVLHNRESWLLSEFGKTSGEGKRFILSELRYLRERDVSKIPSALMRSALKLIGYRLGRMEHRFTPAIKRQLSMHPQFWQ
jgi:rhamnosyltransferase